ncbi:uncharacterized protein EV422DRAFT_519744 [Fimicolochytrium jonesii]|uniref:uncharacterized protein n=1 Tax=Fimicolochytrium jonesii TaxID=1396493 RepID=UPI0022FEF4F3|nr:uncharacterized protein EV422DRAFT_519744 [Fimicolochytrium jonesii]KAI8824321.1 hypothetical protein EV422DRAFT_519744 [Fimicolochytrium jonesii]
MPTNPNPQALTTFLATTDPDPERPCYIILGKPGSGRKTVAKRLAEKVGAVLVTPDAVLEGVVKDQGHPGHEEILETLASGQQVAPDRVVQLMLDAALREAARFRGYMVAGLPNTCKPTTTSTTTPPPDITALIQILNSKSPNQTPILLSLTLADDDLVRRRAAQWIDPLTGTIYPGAQVVFSRAKRAKIGMHENGEEEEEGEHDKGSEAGEEEEEKEDDGDEEEDEEDRSEGSQSGEDEDGERRKRKKKVKEVVKLSNKVEWKMIPMDVVDRLVKRPEDSPDLVTAALDHYNSTYTVPLETVKRKYFNDQRQIELDATQHPDVLIPGLTDALDAIGFGEFGRTVLPRVLEGPGGGFAPGTSPQTAYEHYTTTQLEPDEPARDIGAFANYCPVTAYGPSGKLEPVPTFDYAAVYKGKVYFLASPSHLALFLENPPKYLRQPPTLPELKIAVLGGPRAGKTTLARAVAERYGLVWLSLDEVFGRWESGEVETGFKAVAQKVVQVCSKGEAVPADLQVQVIQSVLDEARKAGKLDRGWVLDGFPQNMEQTNLLIASGIVPQYSIGLQSDVADDKVRRRADVPDLGAALQSTPAHLTSLIHRPFYDELYNGQTSELADVLTVLEQQPPSGDPHDAEGNPAGGKQVVIKLNAADRPGVAFATVQHVLDPFAAKGEVASNLPSPVPFGATKDYDPVALLEHDVLMKGDAANASKYKYRYYYHTTPESLAKFIAEPQTYTTNVHAPPPRLVFVGPPGSGKTAIINELRKKHEHVPHVQWKELVRAYLAAQTPVKVEVSGEEDGDNGEPAAEGDKDMLLDADSGVKVLRELFESEPYKTTGFFLESFPPTKDGVMAVLETHYHVDAFVELTVEADVASRRVASVMRRLGTLPLKQSEDADEDEEEEDLEGVMESIDNGQVDASTITSTVRANSHIPVLEIDANLTIRPTMAAVRTHLATYLENRSSLFCNAYKISPKEAKRALELGVKTYSKFRKYCPVTVNKSRYITRASIGTLPVVYEDCVYFLKDKAARKDFLSNTSKYVNQAPPPPSVHPRVCVIGIGKSGKTTVSKGLAEEMGAVWLDVPLVLQSIIDGGEVCMGLYDELKACLEQGKTVPDEMVAEAVRIITSRAACQEKGWILEGWPMTIQQAKLLEQLGVVPHLVVNLEITEEEVERRCQLAEDPEMSFDTPSVDNLLEITQLRNRGYEDRIAGLAELYQHRYCNWTALDGKKSVWATRAILRARVEKNIENRQLYLEALNKDTAAPIHDVAVNLDEVAKNMGPVGDYCPVSLTQNGELVVGPGGTEYMAVYKGMYYRTAGPSELSMFLAGPTKFVEEGKELPAVLPVRRTPGDVKAMFPAQIELQGYCPVTFAEGPKGFQSIVPGRQDFIAEYDNKLYSMESEQKREAFMRTPWKYASLVLPAKLPPRQTPIPVGNLPLVGYLEQTVATRITEALLAVGKVRPKHPFKSIDASAVEYLALYLKGNNPFSKDWVRNAYKKRLKQFEDHCHLIEALHAEAAPFAGPRQDGTSPNEPSLNPPFIDSSRRPPGFDDRMSQFLALEPSRQALPPIRASQGVR